MLVRFMSVLLNTEEVKHVRFMKLKNGKYTVIAKMIDGDEVYCVNSVDDKKMLLEIYHDHLNYIEDILENKQEDSNN